MARAHRLSVPISKEPALVNVAEGWLNRLRTKPSSRFIGQSIKLKLTKANVDQSTVFLQPPDFVILVSFLPRSPHISPSMIWRAN
jgi:hypothetical protein